MDYHIGKASSRALAVRDRRYAIRYPFAADVEFLDLETGARSVGVTSDISLGGCFVCTSKPLPAKTKGKLILTRKDQRVEGLAVIRIVKPRVGMGLEILDMEPASMRLLERWIDLLRSER